MRNLSENDQEIFLEDKSIAFSDYFTEEVVTSDITSIATYQYYVGTNALDNE